MPDKRTLTQRSETFGLGSSSPWALPALRLLFSAPRVFEPLALAWDKRHPGTLAALDRLESAGFAVRQGPVIVDTLEGRFSDSVSRPVARYRITALGRRTREDASSDIRVLSDLFPKASMSTLNGLLASLGALDSAARSGLSARGFALAAGMTERVGRAWLSRLEGGGLVARMSTLIPDTRIVVPSHWRPSRALVTQLKDAFEDPAFALLSHLKVEFGLARRRQLPEISVDPLAYSGTTDYDHDVRAQAVLGRLIAPVDRIPRSVLVRVEPSIPLLARPGSGSFEVSRNGASMRLSYRPDAEFREHGLHAPARVALEYERMQTRRDAWQHIEKFAAMMHQEAFPFEIGILRFVVDGPRRAAAYRSLAAAFASYVDHFPEAAPVNLIRLTVAEADALLEADDPYAEDLWSTVEVRGAGADVMLVHDSEDSPYHDFFARRRGRSPA